MKTQEQFRLEEAFDRIEALLEKLQDKDVTLEESVKLFSEGAELSRFCYEKLNTAEQKITELSAAKTEE